MPTDQIIQVVLCGGSGTGLWPVSRKSFPKQFVPLINDKSLLELTLARLGKLSNEAKQQALIMSKGFKVSVGREGSRPLCSLKFPKYGGYLII